MKKLLSLLVVIGLPGNADPAAPRTAISGASGAAFAAGGSGSTGSFQRTLAMVLYPTAGGGNFGF